MSFKTKFPITDLEKKAFEIGVCQISAIRLAKRVHGFSKDDRPLIHNNASIENMRNVDNMNKEMLFRIMKICERESIPEQMRRQFLETAKGLSQEEQDSLVRNSSYYSEIELEILAVWEVMSI
jgi:uncharacterized protein (UPF0147 family)